MSLAIEVDDVVSVLLADGWHEVDDRSFLLDSYEYMEGETCMHGGGQSDVCATGFWFQEDSDREAALAGPLSAILAVRVVRE